MPGVTIDRDLLLAVQTIMQENIYAPDLLRSRRDRLTRFYDIISDGVNEHDVLNDSPITESAVTECPRCHVPLDKCPECGDSPSDAALDPEPESFAGEGDIGDYDEADDADPMPRCGNAHCTLDECRP